MGEFSYFDQFEDMTIDLTSYYNECSSGSYLYKPNNNQPVITPIKNLFARMDIVLPFTQNVDALLNYNIKDGESVEVVSHKLYDTTDYWWIIFSFNNITNPFKDWPFTQDQINELTDYLYDNEGLYSRQCYYNFIFEENEKKRKIIVPRAYVIKDIIWAYRQAMLSIE